MCGRAVNVEWQGSTKGPFCRWSEIPGLTPVVGLWGSCPKPKLTIPTQAKQAKPGQPLVSKTAGARKLAH